MVRIAALCRVSQCLSDRVDSLGLVKARQPSGDWRRCRGNGPGRAAGTNDHGGEMIVPPLVGRERELGVLNDMVDRIGEHTGHGARHDGPDHCGRTDRGPPSRRWARIDIRLIGLAARVVVCHGGCPDSTDGLPGLPADDPSVAAQARICYTAACLAPSYHARTWSAG